jgi:hypothetical protein
MQPYSKGLQNFSLSVLKCSLDQQITNILLYRATGLILDSIHRLVCGRQRPQRFGDWICLRPQVDGAG